MLGECQAAFLPVVTTEIKPFVSGQDLPPVTLSCSALPGATPRGNLFPLAWLLVPTAGVRERPRRPGKRGGSGLRAGRGGCLILVAPTPRASGCTGTIWSLDTERLFSNEEVGCILLPRPKLAGELAEALRG